MVSLQFFWTLRFLNLLECILEEELKAKKQLGADFRRTMVDIVRTTHALVQTLELAEERDSLMGLLMTLDYSGFYTEKAM